MAQTEFDLTTASIADITAAFDAGALTRSGSCRCTSTASPRTTRTGQDQRRHHPERRGARDGAGARRRAGGARTRSPLHGIPVLLKDVFDTADMPTTGGYIPLKGVVPPMDATIVARLRAAGAIMLAKVNQSDWYANPDEMASSTLGGSTRNPFALDRTPGWSSAGTGAGLAAHFGTIGLGSETGFSIRTPTSDSNLFGLSTTSGLISRAGQMWSYITGERGGPMAHTVADLAATLDVIAGFDSADLWTAHSLGHMPLQPYASFLDPAGLRGARVGVLAEAWDFTPVDPAVIELAKAAIAVFAEHGAMVFDRLRLALAQSYLDDRELPISQIAWLLGYKEIGAFTHAFRRWTGKTPSEARGQSLMPAAG